MNRLRNGTIAVGAPGSAARRQSTKDDMFIEMLAALKQAERNTVHRAGDCYSNDYMGACCCGKNVLKHTIARAEEVLNG